MFDNNSRIVWCAISHNSFTFGNNLVTFMVYLCYFTLGDAVQPTPGNRIADFHYALHWRTYASMSNFRFSPAAFM